MSATGKAVTFGPVPRGTGWPYMILMALPALWLPWSAIVDLQLFSTGAQPDNSYAGAVMLLVAVLFALAAWSFWYYPWRRSAIEISAEGLRVWRNLAKPPVDIAWSDLTGLSHFDAPRGAATLTFRSQSCADVAVPTAGLQDQTEVITAAIIRQAAALGAVLEDLGPQVQLMGGCEWRRPVRD